MLSMARPDPFQNRLAMEFQASDAKTLSTAARLPGLLLDLLVLLPLGRCGAPG
jgi:hypothetical protein